MLKSGTILVGIDVTESKRGGEGVESWDSRGCTETVQIRRGNRLPQGLEFSLLLLV